MKKIVFLLIIITFSITIILPGLAQPQSQNNDSTTARELFEAGFEYYKQRDFTRATQMWDQILLLNPANPEVARYYETAYMLIRNKHLLMGYVLQRVSDEEFYEAMDVLQQLAEEYDDPMIREWMTGLQNTINEEERLHIINRLISEGDALIEEQNWNEAKEKFLMVLQLVPQHTYAMQRLEHIRRQTEMEQMQAEIQRLLTLAWEQYNNEQFEPALNSCSQILSMDPQNQEAREIINLVMQQMDIENILEQMALLFSQGEDLFNRNDLRAARSRFENVLTFTVESETATDYRTRAQEYITRIDNALETENQRLLMLQEAERFLEQGQYFFRSDKYFEARDKFQNCIVLCDGFEGDEDFDRLRREAENWIARVEEAIKEWRIREQERMVRMLEEYMDQGTTYFYQEQYEACIPPFEKVIELDSANEFGMREQAEYYLERAKEIIRNRLEEEITEDSPYYSLVQNLAETGEELFEQERYEEALEYFNRITTLFPANRMARVMITKISVKLNPAAREIVLGERYTAAVEAMRKKDWRRARAELETIIQIEPNYRDAQTRLTQVETELEAQLVQVVFIDRNQLKTWYDEAQKLYVSGQYQQSIAMAQNILRDTTPDNPYRSKANALMIKARSKMQGGGEQTDTSQTQASSEERRLYLEGVTFYTQGQYKKALQRFEAVLRINPNNSRAAANAEKCRRKLGMR